MSEQKLTPYAISLVLHQDGSPGWRIHLHPNGNEKGYPVSIKEAEELARAATEILNTVTQDDKAVTPFMIVRNGTTVLRDTYKAALEEAEAKAANIPHLRRALGEMGEG
jgi:hypothetical protein